MLHNISNEVISEIAAKDKLSRELFENIISFRELAIFWSHYSEADYLNARILNN